MIELFAFLVAIAFATAAWRIALSIRGDLAALRREIVELRVRVIEANAAPRAQAPAAAPPAHAPEPPPAPAPVPQPPQAETPAPVAEEAPRPVPAAPAPTQPAATLPKPRAQASGGDDIERTLLGRWAVWLGAVALALGGVFLVKYSIDRDLIGPGMRVLLGVLLGGSLTAGGELLRRHMPRLDNPRIAYLPPAVTASGISTLFASVFAAHALYAFIGTTVAFVSLAAVAALAVVLSLRQGPFIALLGLVAAMLVPALVQADAPSAWTLFGYLLIVMVGSLALARDRGWLWLAWPVLGGAVAWSVLWIATAPRDLDPVVLPGFVVIAAGLFFTLRRPGEPAAVEIRTVTDALNSGIALIWTAAAAFGLVMLMLIGATHHATIPLVAVGVLVVLYLLAAYRDEAFDYLAQGAALLAIAVIASWAVPFPVASPYGEALSLAPAFPPMVTTAGIYAAILGAGCHAILWRAARPQRWAVASAAAPVLLLIAVYLHRADALGELPWAAIGLAVAGLEVLAASRIVPVRERPGMEATLAAYAVGAVAAVALAFTISLERSWLTVALALMLPALGWIADRTRVATLRPVAMVMAAVVLGRLLVNRDLAEAPVADSLFFNWILYSYGLPFVAFIAAARLFRDSGGNRLVTVLEAGTIATGCAFIALEIRHAFASGTLLGGRVTAGEIAAYACALLLAAAFVYRRANVTGHAAFTQSAPFIAGAAGIFTVIGPLLAYNPLIVAEPVGDLFFLNALLPLYALPLVLSLYLRMHATRAGATDIANGFGILALVLGFTFVSLSVRHAFHGSIILHGHVGDAETYTYSLAWLAYGALLLGGGVLRDNQPVRYAGLTVLTLAVAKTFLIDMSALTGLYRAASFLGLGASLLGVGYLYQRFVRAIGRDG